MIKYPLFFEVSANSESGINTLFEASALDFPPITCAIPPEFKGPGGGYSPEELLAIAVMSCLIATFKVFAERGKLQYASIDGKAKLTVDRNAQGMTELRKLDFMFTFSGVQDKEKASMLLAEAKKYCLVSNAVKTEQSIDHKFI